LLRVSIAAAFRLPNLVHMMKSNSWCSWPVAVFIISFNLAEVIAHRQSTLDAEETNTMASRIAVTSGRSSSASRSVDKVLQTFAEQRGMLSNQFNEEWPLVAEVFNEHCCPEEGEELELPAGGEDVSMFIADYSNLPSLAVLVTANAPVRAQLAVVYARGDTVGAPIFGLLENPAATHVTPNFKIDLVDHDGQVGIYQVPKASGSVRVYLTASSIRNANAFNLFKVLGKIDEPEFQMQARRLGMTVTLSGGQFHMSEGIQEMLDLPGDSLVVADPVNLQEGKRSLALYRSKNNLYPAMVSSAVYHKEGRWKVYVRYLPATPNQINLLDLEVTCALFGTDLMPVLAPAPPPDKLAKAYLNQVRGFGVDPFKAAVLAAELTKMPKLEIPEGYFDTKVKTLPFDNGLNLYVLYHHAQRSHAYANNRIFEHVFDRKDKNAGTTDISVLSQMISKINEANLPAAMTFLLSEQRFAMGWAMDGVELGTGHNCLIKDEQEKVYIAGEIKFEEDRVSFNFLSGTFTRQIAPLYESGEVAFETQWKNLMSELITEAWYSKLTRLTKLKSDPVQLRFPQVTSTDDVLIPFSAPVQDTTDAFCHSKPWMKPCACMASGDLYVSYCEALAGRQGVPCDHDSCHP